MTSLVLDGPDRYRALARSSPWRWRSVHLVRAAGGVHDDDVEAWVRRPHEMRVETWGEVHVVRERPTTVAWYGTDGHGAQVVLPRASDVDPVVDDAGLVTVRPSDAVVSYDDPMWQSYDWVAMLDPAELADGSAHRGLDGADIDEVPLDPEPYPDLDWPTSDTVPGVELTDLRETTREGRRTWWATAVPLETYE